MRVFHILKDGSRPTDITGHIVRLKDAKSAYQLLSKSYIRTKRKNEVLHNESKKRA